MALPSFVQIPAAANATVGGAAFTGFFNPDQLAAIQNIGGGNALMFVGTLQITIPLAFVQANWKQLFFDRLESA